MTFVPSRYRAAVTPRTPFEKSYSGRIVSRSESVDLCLALSFFIVLALASGGESGSDDSGSGWSVYESYYEKSAGAGRAEDQVPLLAARAVPGGLKNRERLAK